jgi:hypothetical protein
MTTKTKTATAKAKAGRCWLENPKGWCWADFFGVGEKLGQEQRQQQQQQQRQG